MMANNQATLAINTHRRRFHNSQGMIFGATLSVHKHVVIYMHLLAAGPLLYGLLPLFFYSVDADIASKESTFPTWWFTFPLTTRTLVGWPMLYGTAAIALTWLALASLIFRLNGINLPLWWPAMLLASCVAWIQAMAWRPFGLPFLRMVMAVVPIAVLISISSLRWAVHLPEPVVSLLLGSTILPAYAVAVVGVARARCGDQPDHRWLSDYATSIASRFLLRGKNFASPSQAQVWFEWRRYGLGLPIMTGMVALFLALPLIVTNHNLRFPYVILGGSPLLLLVAPFFVTMFSSVNWGSCGNPHRGQVMSVFLATQPMTCNAHLWAKMKAAAISLAITWAATLMLMALMFLFMGPWNDLIRQWDLLTQDFSYAQKVGLPVLVLLLLPLVTWRIIISNLYVSSTGRSWVEVPIVIAMGMGVAYGFFLVCTCFIHPEYGYMLLSVLPWVLGAAVLIKLTLGTWIIGVLTRRQLVPTRLIKRLLVAWVLTAISLSGLFCWLIPSSLVPWYLIVVCVVLTLPLVRISLAPLALAWNRHR